MMKKDIKWLFVFLAVFMFEGLVEARAQYSFHYQYSGPDTLNFGGSVYVPEDRMVEAAVAVFGSTTVAGKVRKDAVAIGGDVILKSTAMVGGNVVAVGGKIYRESGAMVKGNVVEIGGGMNIIRQAVPSFFKIITFAGLIYRLICLLTFIILVALGMAFLPQQVEHICKAIKTNPLKVGLIGLLGLIAVPILCLLVGITIIGLPLIPFIILLAGFSIILGAVGLALLVGRQVQQSFGGEESKPMLAVLIGALLLSLAAFIPFAGGLIFVIIHIFGFGGVILTRFGTRNIAVCQHLA